MNGLLSAQIWIPFLGAVWILGLRKSSPHLVRLVALFTAVLSLLASVIVVGVFDRSSFHFQLVESYRWMPTIGIRYQLGVDGVSLWLVALTSLMCVVAVAMSRYVDRHVHAYFAFILALESFLHGAFLSLDLILFFTFFELTLFPAYFLITLWGGNRRSYAGAKFFIYTFAGSIFMLIGMIAIASRVPGGSSFDLVRIQQSVADGSLWRGHIDAETLVFWSFAVGLLIKTPAFPFHSWIADTYSEAPAVVPVLSSIMVKLGSFGLLRFCLPLFPDVISSQVWLLMILAVVGIVYGAILAAVQKNAMRLIAYSSLSHMGFVLLGICSLTHAGLMGGAYQQINHGVVSGGLIVLLAFLWQRRKSNDLDSYGGLKSQMPVFAALFLILMLASAGLPGTNGFVGEFLALLGAFESGARGFFGQNLLYPVLAGAGVVLAAVYLLSMFQKLFYGQTRDPRNLRLRDLKPWEIGTVSVLAAIAILGGVCPNLFLKPMEASLQAARLMATASEGQRPVWADADQRIDLAADSPSRGALIGADPAHVISPATLHYGLPPDAQTSVQNPSLPRFAMRQEGAPIPLHQTRNDRGGKLGKGSSRRAGGAPN